MMFRLLICLVLSLIIHAIIVMQPARYPKDTKDNVSHLASVPVKLVDYTSQVVLVHNTSTVTKVQKAPPTNNVEGVSFKVEGGVGVAYVEKLRIKIFKIWQYPEDAIQKGEQGKVTLTFVINSKGELVDMGIYNSSGSRSLDNAAMAAVKKAVPYGPFTPDIKENTLKITGDFCYVLD
jgi:TonB family protein